MTNEQMTEGGSFLSVFAALTAVAAFLFATVCVVVVSTNNNTSSAVHRSHTLGVQDRDDTRDRLGR
jgi:hypothetical protein